MALTYIFLRVSIRSSQSIIIVPYRGGGGGGGHSYLHTIQIKQNSISILYLYYKCNDCRINMNTVVYI